MRGKLPPPLKIEGDVWRGGNPRKPRRGQWRARRHGIAAIYGNGAICGICNLHNLKEAPESESHTLSAIRK
jgi:hypothetical protein